MQCARLPAALTTNCTACTACPPQYYIPMAAQLLTTPCSSTAEQVQRQALATALGLPPSNISISCAANSVSGVNAGLLLTPPARRLLQQSPGQQQQGQHQEVEREEEGVRIGSSRGRRGSSSTRGASEARALQQSSLPPEVACAPSATYQATLTFPPDANVERMRTALVEYIT